MSELGYKREGDVVTLTMTDDDWQRFQLTLGMMLGEPGGSSFFPFLALINRLNAGNPNFTPYEIPET